MVSAGPLTRTRWITEPRSSSAGGQPSFSGTNQTPIAREALERSLVRLLEADVALPADFAKDYESWKSAKGGFFTMTVAEIAAMVRASGAYQANTTKTVAATGYIKK